MKTVLTHLFIFWYLTSPFIGIIAADGGVFGKNNEVISIPEDSQFGVIDYYDGVEELFITINFHHQPSSTTAWILPIASLPEKIHIDLINGQPIFSGEDFQPKIKGDLIESMGLSIGAYASSAFIPFPLSNFIIDNIDTIMGPSMGGLGKEAGVDVYHHLEKGGFVTEIISATEGEGIYLYLTKQNLTLSEGIIPQLDRCVELNYSFAVTWLNRTDQPYRSPGILIEFPSDKIFYPMILTSVYENTIVPIDLIVTNHVSPNLDDDVQEHSTITYYIDGKLRPSYHPSSTLNSFLRKIISHWDRKFTKISIRAPSELFTNDIWMEDTPPETVEYSLAIYSMFNEKTRGGTITVMVFTISLIFGGIFGIIFFGPKRRQLPLYFLLGVCNFVGILCLLLTFLIIRRYKDIPFEKEVGFTFSIIITTIVTLGLFFAILTYPIS